MWSLSSGAVNIRLNYMKWLGQEEGYGSVRYWQVCITDLVELHFVSSGFVTVGGKKTSFGMR